MTVIGSRDHQQLFVQLKILNLRLGVKVFTSNLESFVSSKPSKGKIKKFNTFASALWFVMLVEGGKGRRWDAQSVIVGLPSE